MNMKFISTHHRPAIFLGMVSPTPLGSIWVAISEKGLIAVQIGGDQVDFTKKWDQNHHHQIIFTPEKAASVIQQIAEYLSAKRSVFDIPIDWDILKPFQQLTLKATYSIPYGQTRTYAEIARQIGKPYAARAVGNAEATNPMPLVIPCHRVIGTDGKLHGYGAPGGSETKAWLLRLEGAL